MGETRYRPFRTAAALLCPAVPLPASPGMGAVYGTALEWFAFLLLHAAGYALPAAIVAGLVAGAVHAKRGRPAPWRRALQLAGIVYGALLVLAALVIAGMLFLP